MTHTSLTLVQLTLLMLLALPPLLHAHGVMNMPPQRGCLKGDTDFTVIKVDDSAPTDWNQHFPAGSKAYSPGAGLNSQRQAAGSRGWTPFKPLQNDFRWRAGVCGDLKGGVEHHRRGGEYYFDGKIVKSYRQGGVIALGLSIVGYHNGFVELHACNMAKCANGEISESCFKTPGACRKLERQWNSGCQTGADRRCGPIDRNYPERWYLPCAKYPNENKIETFGKTSILYKIPDDFHCEHCVLHWYWATANACNPPGLREYFEGADRPKNWGNCEGEGSAEGGYSKHLADCGGDRFAEEYHQCADITITPREGDASTPETRPPATMPPATMPPATMPPATMTHGSMARSTVPRTDRRTDPPKRHGKGADCGPYDVNRGLSLGYGAVRDIVIRANGCRTSSLNHDGNVHIGSYRWVAIEAIVEAGVRYVDFYIDGRKVFTDRRAPFLLFGGAWRKPILNRAFLLTVSAQGDNDSVSVSLVK